MKSGLYFTIKKRSQTECLLWILVILPFCLGALTELIGLPWAIRYLLDVAWVIAAVLMIRYCSKINVKKINVLMLWTVSFLSYTLLVYLIQYQSGWYYLWGFRNNFRFYVAFFAFTAFLKREHVTAYLDVFDKLFWINLIITLFQNFILHINGDYLGGIFGISQGVNGYTNIFLLIVITKSICFFLDKKESAWTCAAKCILAFLVAAMTEIKFFYIEFIAVVMMVVLFSNFTWRKFWIILGAIAAIFAFTSLMAIFFPSSSDMLSFDWFRAEASSDKGYTSSGDLNRLTAIMRINELWLTNWGQRLFGLGLGNCDTSSFALVNTPFYEQYGHMHYTWMSYAIMYLECGWIGLIFYFGFFVLMYLAIERIEKCADSSIKSYCRISKILAICCVLISVYNSSLRAESGYMAYFVLAIPFALNRDSMRKIR